MYIKIYVFSFGDLNLCFHGETHQREPCRDCMTNNSLTCQLKVTEAAEKLENYFFTIYVINAVGQSCGVFCTPHLLPVEGIYSFPIYSYFR